MGHADVTMVANAIHNPAEPRHFMRIKPVDRQVVIWRDGERLAETTRAVRLLEAGKDLYDPVLYLPAEDVSPRLKPGDAPASHCPLKGDAAYFDLVGPDGAVLVPKIAWSYPDPFDFASELAGRIAFYASQVTVEEVPLPGA